MRRSPPRWAGIPTRHRRVPPRPPRRRASLPRSNPTSTTATPLPLRVRRAGGPWLPLPDQRTSAGTGTGSARQPLRRRTSHTDSPLRGRRFSSTNSRRTSFPLPLLPRPSHPLLPTLSPTPTFPRNRNRNRNRLRRPRTTTTTTPTTMTTTTTTTKTLSRNVPRRNVRRGLRRRLLRLLLQKRRSEPRWATTTTRTRSWIRRGPSRQSRRLAVVVAAAEEEEGEGGVGGGEGG